MTVTGTWLPSSPKTWVIPILRPMSPSLRAISLLGGGLDGLDLLHHWGRRRQSRRSKARPQDDQHGPDTSRRGGASPNGEHREARGRSRPERTRLYVRIGDDRERSEATPVGLASELDLDVDAGGQVELHQRVHGLRRGIDNVEESLVGAHLELLARGLVDVWAPQHGPAIDDRRQQHWSRDAGARPAHGLHDLLDRPIKQLMIVGLQADADFLIGGQGRHALLRDLRDDAGPYPPPPLPDPQPHPLLHRPPPQHRPLSPPRPPFPQQLPNHRPPRPRRLARLPNPPHPPLSPPLPPPPPHPPRHHRPPPRDRKNVLDRHQKRLVDRPHRRRNVAVHRPPHLPNAPARLRVLPPLHRPPPRPPAHRHRAPPKLVLLHPLPHLPPPPAPQP